MEGFSISIFVFGLLTGGALGVMAALILGRRGREHLAGEAAVLCEKNLRVSELESALEAERRAREENGRQAAELLVRLEVAEDLQREQAERLTQAKDEMNQAFRALAADALRQNNETFVEMARSSLAICQAEASAELEKREMAVGELVKPIRETLAQVHDRIYEIEKARIGAYHGLSEQVVSMAAGQEKLQRETTRLVMALKTPVVRGRWGEIQLKRVVELAGMLEYCDFEQQPVTSGEENGRQRPDLIVHMPGYKKIAVDAKVPLAAYMEALETDGEEHRAAGMRQHARQVRQHINNLAGKAYWRGLDFTPELVVMFLPGEMLFSAALEQDPGLLEYGAQQHVIIATPTTLIALLRTVAHGWQHEQLTENARQIQMIGQELYDRIGGLIGHIEDVGGALRKAARSYNAMIGSLENRVLVSARRFREMGVSAGEPLPALEAVREDVREMGAEV